MYASGVFFRCPDMFSCQCKKLSFPRGSLAYLAGEILKHFGTVAGHYLPEFHGLIFILLWEIFRDATRKDIKDFIPLAQA